MRKFRVNILEEIKENYPNGLKLLNENFPTRNE